MKRCLATCLIFMLSACTATDKLTKEGAYITATPALDAQHTAFMLNQGFWKCSGRPGLIQQISDTTWLVTFQIPGSLIDDAMYAIEITDSTAKIAPFVLSPALRRQSGLIAEWIEAGTVTECEPTDRHAARWQ